MLIAIQHKFNPLHLFCRLCDLGLSDKTAKKVSEFYERLIKRLLYRK